MHYSKTFGKYILACLLLAPTIWAQSTQFTYQGTLKDGGSPANGTYDLEFALFNSQDGGLQFGPTIVRPGVSVASGNFSVALDFGDQFPGSPRFLEIRVRQSGVGAFTPLSPRQMVNSAPYSIRSIESDTSLTAVSATTAANSTNSVNFTGGLNGDVTGTQGSTTVARIQGRNVANTLPANGQVLKYDSTTSQWKPAADETGAGGGTITAITAGAGLTGGGTSGSVSLGIANGGVGTPQLTDGSVTDAKITAVSGAKVTGTVANAANATQLGGNPASSYLQAVAINSTLSGTGSSASPLGISVPLSITGNAPLPGVLSVNNSNANSAAVSATLNGVGSAIRGVNSGLGPGIFGTSNDTSDGNGGVHGEAPAGNGVVGIGGRAGVYGLSSTGNGVSGNSGAPLFAGVAGYHQNTGDGVFGLTANGKAIHGMSTNGFAGYFEGRSYFSDNVGVGTTAPTERLHVVGNGVFTGNLAVTGTFSAPSLAGQFIRNTTEQQPSSNFNVSGNGIIGGNLRLGNVSDGRVASDGGNSVGLFGRSDSSYGVFGRHGNPTTVSGVNRAGVRGDSSGYAGVIGTSDTAAGVYGVSSSGTGVSGQSASSDGVVGLSVSASGVYGQSLTSIGVEGFSTYDIAVRGSTGQGLFGVIGKVGSSSSFPQTYVGKAAVWGDSSAAVGMFGTSEANVGVVGVSASSIGVLGRTLDVNGIAGRFEGMVAVTSLGGGGINHLCHNNVSLIAQCSSSLRYKSNIEPFGNGLEIIQRLRPIRFDWKDGLTPDLGLAAEDVEKIEPLLVTYSKDARVEGVKYDRIGVILINAVKEQQAQIKQHEATIKSQQAQIDALITLACRRNTRAEICRKRR